MILHITDRYVVLKFVIPMEGDCKHKDACRLTPTY